MGGPGVGASTPNVALRKGDCVAGKYLVEDVLGAGGMGMVLAARHAVLGTRVAIKLLLPAASAIPGATERFVREARAAAVLRSEHVARVMDVGMLDGGAPYLVMEYLTGQDLRALLRSRGPLPVGEVAAYMLQVCDAMAEAHRLGIVHRDLKPANLFLTERPNGTPLVKVLDFGLAKVLDEAPKAVHDASLTATGVVIGSPPYMPPEQLRSLKLADARSDLWSLGVILYELLTGRQPFSADRTEGLIVAIATDQPPPPRSLRPELPEAIETIILRCLRKDARDRVQTVQEVAAVLEPFASASRPSFASTASPFEGQRSQTSTAPLIPALVGAVPMVPAPAVGAPRPTTLAGGPQAAAASPSGAAPDAPRHTAPMERAPEITDAAQRSPSSGGTTTLSVGSSEVSAARHRPFTKGFGWPIGGLVALLALIGGVLWIGLRSKGTPAPAGSSSLQELGAGTAARSGEAPAAATATASASASSEDPAGGPTANAATETPVVKAPPKAPTTAIPPAASISQSPVGVLPPQKSPTGAPTAPAPPTATARPSPAGTATKSVNPLKDWQ